MAESDGETTQSQGAQIARYQNRWKPGQSGNPGGKPKYVVEYAEAIRRGVTEQETVKRVLKVVAAMRKDALSHGKNAPAAAKVYFQVVGVDMNPDKEQAIAAIKAHLDELLQEAERLEADARESMPALPPVTP